MTREDIVKAYAWIRKNNNTIPDDVLDFMKRSAIDALDSKWIKIESEKDLPTNEGSYFVFSKVSWPPYYRVDVFTGRLSNSFQDGKSIFSHYQPIRKPEPPIY